MCAGRVISRSVPSMNTARSEVRCRSPVLPSSCRQQPPSLDGNKFRPPRSAPAAGFFVTVMVPTSYLPISIRDTDLWQMISVGRSQTCLSAQSGWAGSFVVRLSVPSRAPFCALYRLLLCCLSSNRSMQTLETELLFTETQPEEDYGARYAYARVTLLATSHFRKEG
jgi:hypothetical protein